MAPTLTLRRGRSWQHGRDIRSDPHRPSVPPSPVSRSANGGRVGVGAKFAYRSVIAALLITGVPRSLVLAATRILLPSRHIEVTIVSPGKTTPAKRAW